MNHYLKRFQRNRNKKCSCQYFPSHLISQAASLRKQVETIKRERAAMGLEVESPCGPGAPCKAQLDAMELAHRKALRELQEKHSREMKELEEQKHRIVQEKNQAAAKGKRGGIKLQYIKLHF